LRIAFFNIFIATVALTFLCSCTPMYYEDDGYDYQFFIKERCFNNKLSKIVDEEITLVSTDNPDSVNNESYSNDSLESDTIFFSKAENGLYAAEVSIGTSCGVDFNIGHHTIEDTLFIHSYNKDDLYSLCSCTALVSIWIPEDQLLQSNFFVINNNRSHVYTIVFKD